MSRRAAAPTAARRRAAPAPARARDEVRLGRVTAILASSPPLSTASKSRSVRCAAARASRAVDSSSLLAAATRRSAWRDRPVDDAVRHDRRPQDVEPPMRSRVGRRARRRRACAAARRRGTRQPRGSTPASGSTVRPSIRAAPPWRASSSAIASISAGISAIVEEDPHRGRRAQPDRLGRRGLSGAAAVVTRHSRDPTSAGGASSSGSRVALAARRGRRSRRRAPRVRAGSRSPRRSLR